MKLLALLLALTHLPGQQEPKTTTPDPDHLAYQSLLLGLKFEYPKAWQVTTNKKSESRILIPIPNSSDRAVIEVLPVNFRGEPNIWQLTQVGINKTMKREVQRQWDEEILGVPLLLTKVSYSEEGSQKTSETGLLYTFGFNKLMYRITASPDEFDQVDYSWRQVLQSLRTWDGEMPTAEDPSKKIERKEVPKGGFAPDELPHPTIPHDVSTQPVLKPVKAPVASTLDFNGRKVELRVPTDWKVDSDKNGGFILHGPGFVDPVNVTVFPVDGSDPANIAMQKASAHALDDFTSVTTREEPLPTTNKAGESMAAVWRTGVGAKGTLFTCEAFCKGGDYYLLLTYRSDSAARWKSERALVQSLLERMSVEPAP